MHVNCVCSRHLAGLLSLLVGRQQQFLVLGAHQDALQWEVLISLLTSAYVCLRLLASACVSGPGRGPWRLERLHAYPR